MPAIFISNHEAREIIAALEYAIACAEADALSEKFPEGRRQPVEYRQAIRRQNRYSQLLAEIKRRINK